MLSSAYSFITTRTPITFGCTNRHTLQPWGAFWGTQVPHTKLEGACNRCCWCSLSSAYCLRTSRALLPVGSKECIFLHTLEPWVTFWTLGPQTTRNRTWNWWCWCCLSSAYCLRTSRALLPVGSKECIFLHTLEPWVTFWTLGPQTTRNRTWNWWCSLSSAYCLRTSRASLSVGRKECLFLHTLEPRVAPWTLRLKTGSKRTWLFYDRSRAATFKGCALGTEASAKSL